MITETKEKPNIKVMMYHRVIEQKPANKVPWHYNTCTDFEKQIQLMDWFGFTPITFIDFKLYQEGKLTLPAKPIIITFDDGYLDTYQNAAPILQKYRMNGVVFVMGNRSIKTAYWDHATTYDYCPLMSDQQVRELKDKGFEIGSHTMSHENLLKIPESEAVYQIKCSKTSIEDMLQAPVSTFAYPYGAVNERLIEVVNQTGYNYACGVYTGPPRFGHSEYDIRRVAVNQHTSVHHFLIKLLTPYQYLDWMYYKFMSGRKKAVKKDNHIKNMITELSNNYKQ